MRLLVFLLLGLLATYYILHRYDFGLGEAPIGACILYAMSCSLTDRELTGRFDLLTRIGVGVAAEEDADDSEEEGASSRTKVKLKAWSQRHRKSLGPEADGRPAPLIDQIHRLMRFWKAGDAVKVDECLDARALRRNSLLARLLKALIELSSADGEERPWRVSATTWPREAWPTRTDKCP